MTARDLLQHNPNDEQGPLWVCEHLAHLVLHSEPTVVEDPTAQRLAPLEQLRPAQQERLVATLLSWLQHHGQRTAMAAELLIHEQTVGYRINQLREVFGEDLNDPQTRFELELVLRARGHQSFSRAPSTHRRIGEPPGPQALTGSSRCSTLPVRPPGGGRGERKQ